jgi:tartrate dehydratase alpha subunit/fumarate hydratase class I-like protein
MQSNRPISRPTIAPTKNAQPQSPVRLTSQTVSTHVSRQLRMTATKMEAKVYRQMTVRKINRNTAMNAASNRPTCQTSVAVSTGAGLNSIAEIVSASPDRAPAMNPTVAQMPSRSKIFLNDDTN